MNRKPPKAAVPSSEKNSASKSLDLSLKAKAGSSDEPLDSLPSNFRDTTDELRKLDLSGQVKLGKHLNDIRFAGETLTWLNLAGVDCTQAQGYLWLKMLKTLFVLNMSNCNLEELPKEISSVISLKALVVSHNQLTSPSLSHLSGLSALNSLILSDNQLTSVPSSITSLKSLKKLSLSNNKLRSDALPDFTGLDALEDLRLNGNKDISAVPAGLAALPVLTLLELSNTAIASLSEVEKLHSCPKLVNLGIKGTPLASAPDYRDQVTRILPNLRILDNTRFDPRFLQRKEKLRARQAGEEGAGPKVRTGEGKDKEKKENGKSRPSAPAKEKADKKQQEPGSISTVKLGKRKAEHQDSINAEMSGAGQKSKGKKAKQGRDDETQATVHSDAQAEPAALPSAVPKKKRSRFKKRLERQEAAAVEGSSSSMPVAQKQAKQIGGSLSAPAKEAESPVEPQQPIEPRLEDLAKARSSVVTIVDATRGKKKEKSKPVVGDVMALLQQEREAAAVTKGWD